MNSMFDGIKVPTADTSLSEPEHANEVSLNALLTEMSEVELDFLRQCLVIDGLQRSSVNELLVHEYFDEEFRTSIEEQIQELNQEDERLRAQ